MSPVPGFPLLPETMVLFRTTVPKPTAIPLPFALALVLIVQLVRSAPPIRNNPPPFSALLPLIVLFTSVRLIPDANEMESIPPPEPED